MLGWLRRALQPDPPPPQAPPAPGVGGVLGGRYRLDARLGRGGTGTVFRGRDLLLDQDVAVKLLRRESPALQRTGVVDLRREAVAAMRVSHPGIARVHTFDSDPVSGSDFIVMEYIDGATLTRCQRARPDGRLPLDVVGPVMVDVLDALACAHEAGLVHNDINPANIMITRRGQVKLLDFGLAGAARGGGGAAMMGTPAYLSPERIAGEPAGPTSDLYSLAAVLFTMVDGQPPFGRDPSVAVVGHTTQPLRVSPLLPRPVAAVVNRAMAKRPDDRFPGARDMAQALRAALAAAAAPVSVLRATHAPEPLPDPEAVECTDIVMVDEGEEVSTLLAMPADDEQSELLPEELAGAGAGALGAEDAVTEEAPADRDPPSPAPVEPVQDVVTEAIPGDMARVGGHPVAVDGAPVAVGAFLLERLPVTNARYAAFVAATGELAPAWWAGRQPPADRQDHPVVGVSLAQARRYAAWAGRRLPTTLEWMAAARGPGGRPLPWGAACDRAACHCPRARARHTAPVHAHPAGQTPEGVGDLIGNVWEWTEHSPGLAPADPGYHLVMGGSFKHPCSLPERLPQTAVHEGGEYLYLGFRCAADLPGAGGGGA